MTDARIIVEIGFVGPGSGTSLTLDDTSRGVLGTGTLAADGVWTDVTPYVVSVSTRRGATRADGPILRYEAGTATIVLRNDDRRFDPTNLDGPYVAAGDTQVKPMRAVRVRAAWASATYPLWQGYADEWRVSYDGPNSSQVALTCSDGFSVLASHDRGASVPAGGGEDTGARVGRILDSVDWPDVDRVIAVGDSTVQETTLADNALAELLLTVDSELGELYMDAQGRVTFRNRRGVVEDDRSATSQATFGDGGGGELPYADVVVSYDAQSIYNRVSIARVGGTAQVAEDTASQSAYLVRTYTRTDLLLESDSECADYAGYLLHQGRQPELRFASILLKPSRDAGLWPQALGREIGDRVTAVRRPPGGGDPIERDVIVRGIEHEVVVDQEWRTRFVFQSASRLSFLVLDDAALGALDDNALAY
ncbi:hypothetical protein [Micromonospora sp. WMMD998]|uniref:hypothetical protein n=1 Tax=Micromonospora sp. WMMD998 TaxID=3016092 RepID=UPI00249A42EA|nr:hypothetical protein [Micromonospora sp. WMMD998]WFE41959.1 hypothetical protein O7619_27325 [Micromonospora sp. WMMD998]